MGLMNAADRRFAQLVAELVGCNPFVARRIELERQALGRAFLERDADWNLRSTPSEEAPNVRQLVERVDAFVELLRDRLARGVNAEAADRDLYESLVWFAMFHRFRDGFDAMIASEEAGARAGGRTAMYEPFARTATRLLSVGASPGGPGDAPGGVVAHLFAICFQVRRAFHYIFRWIVGASGPSVRLRAAVWQSVFTHDLHRYRRLLYRHMADFTTLITGPSGTGKELVARAVGLARYVPFDEAGRRFAEGYRDSFLPLNISAMSPTLVESELFGHRRGAYTGAVAERVGWLESCPDLGTVFLDEVGEIEPAIQVKLLRVLQTRGFHRLGETRERRFRGKLLAATNRDLPSEMDRGRFRGDLYYRLCSDIIVTPSLREQLDDEPDDLNHLVHAICRRLLGDEAERVSGGIIDYIRREFADHAWPGNIRELEQCVRNVLVRGSYRPATPQAAGDPERRFCDDLAHARLTAEQVLSGYCKIVHRRLGSYEASARALGLDRRTVKAKVLAASAGGKA